MKLLVSLAAVMTVHAQMRVPDSDGPSLRGGRREKNKERASTRAAISQYVRMVVTELKDEPMAVLFAKAIQDKASREGIPEHLLQEIENLNNPKATARELNCRDPSCKIPLGLRGIWNYGCWCNFGDALTTGAGTPVSPHDYACQSMQQCLRCSRRDGIEDGYECDPKTVDYKAQFRFMPSMESLMGDCSSFNPADPCGTHLCTCELQLIADILELVWSGVVYDKSFLHSEGWNHMEMCATAGVNADQQCCGGYPRRTPYNAESKDCCLEEIFSPLSQQCCATGVKDVGEFC